MSTRASVCFSAVCVILIAQVSSAYEVKPCDGYNGTLYSVEVHNCPNKTAEYCEIKWFSEIVWDANYTVGVSYDTAWTGYIYDDAFMPDEDLCEDEPDFCPGKAGEEQSHQFKIAVEMFLPQTGVVRPLKLTTHTHELDSFHVDFIVCAELPVKFVDNY